MKRRTYLQTLLAAGAGPAIVRSASANPPVVLAGDLTIDPEKEEGLLKTSGMISGPRPPNNRASSI